MPSYTILVLTRHQASAEMLFRRLSVSYRVVLADSVQTLDTTDCDLIVVDGQLLQEFSLHLLRRKYEEQSAYLPILVLARSSLAGLTSANVWEYVDDVLQIPIDYAKLQAKIAVLIRIRGASLRMQQERQHSESRNLPSKSSKVDTSSLE